MRNRIEPTSESATGISIGLDIASTATGSISRNGQEVEQSFKHPTTNDLVVGARLLHKIDFQMYEIVKWEDPLFTIRRLQDDTDHAATLRQLKSHTLLYIERCSGNC